ncbi:MAG: protoporphyrinogen oxidase [Oscillochloris sp.]|nr:protoporphyrinogen oxidase [Oscillochloris sp.]
MLSTRAKLRLLAEPLLPRSREPESVAAFFGRRLGPEPLQRLIDPFVSGVYAGNPQELSMQAAFPRLWQAEQRAGSLLLGMLTAPRPKRQKGEARSQRRLFSFHKGLATWPQAIARFLGPERLWTGARALDLRPTDGEWHVTVQRAGVVAHLLVSQVILAVPAAVAAHLVDRLDAQAAAALRAIPYPPVTLVHLGYRRSDVAHPLDGFGLLCPSDENAKVLGTLWPSSLFPNRAPAGSVLTTAFVGGARNSVLTNQSEEALIAMVHAEQQRIIGVRAEPVFARTIRWPQAIPQYNAGHLRRIAAIAQLEQRRLGLHLIGNYRGGISVEACWQQGRAAAALVARLIAHEPAPTQ